VSETTSYRPGPRRPQEQGEPVRQTPGSSCRPHSRRTNWAARRACGRYGPCTAHGRVRHEAAARPRMGRGIASCQPRTRHDDIPRTPPAYSDGCMWPAGSIRLPRQPARRGGGRQAAAERAAAPAATPPGAASRTARPGGTHRSSPPRPAGRPRVRSRRARTGRGQPAPDPSVPHPRGYAIPAP